MYLSSSYLSPKCIVGKSKINGRGLFTKENIKKGELISIWGGKIIPIIKMKKIGENHQIFTHSIGVYDKFVLGMNAPLGKIEDCDKINHSCSPNAGVRGQIVLIARKKIMKGEEICFDYETTEIAGCGGLPIICKCGSQNCRGVIDGNAWKDSKFQQRNKGYLSWYIEEKINKLIRKKKP